MGRNKTVTDREQYVVKANSIIRTRYTLPLRQQRLILFCISKIRPHDAIGTDYTFTIKEICEACGIDDESGYYYQTIKDDFQKLTRREWGITPSGAHVTLSWIGDVKIEPYSGTVTISFNKHMQPYLYDLQKNYTQYKLVNALVFKSRHTIHLYEILRSYTTQAALDSGRMSSVSFTVREIKEFLDCQDAYPRWAEFDRSVLKKAVAEINECCDDIHIEYETNKSGRAISSVDFIITKSTPVQYLKAHDIRRKRL